MPEKENKIERANGAASGAAIASVQNVLKSTTSQSTVLSVLDKSLQSAKGTPVPLMTSHVGASNLINAHKSFATVVPRTPISAGQKAAEIAGKINEVSSTILLLV